MNFYFSATQLDDSTFPHDRARETSIPYCCISAVVSQHRSGVFSPRYTHLASGGFVYLGGFVRPARTERNASGSSMENRISIFAINALVFISLWPWSPAFSVYSAYSDDLIRVLWLPTGHPYSVMQSLEWAYCDGRSQVYTDWYLGLM